VNLPPLRGEANYTGGLDLNPGLCQHSSLVPIDPSRFEQFFRRNSSGDWVYVGYGPDVYGRVVSAYDREWLLANLPRLSAWKRWTVGLFSAPLVWLFAVFLYFVTSDPLGGPARWLLRRREEAAMLAMVLLLLFLLSSVVLALQPTAKEFGKVLAKKPKDEPIGAEKFMRNVGAVNGPWISAFLMGGFGFLVVPMSFTQWWPYFVPFSLAWLWMAWHAMAGALWKPEKEEI
jgi:hypothetical protein